MNDLRVGVLGAGGRGGLARRAHMPGEGSVVVACCDTNQKVFERMQTWYGDDVFLTESAHELLAQDLDAVMICTPDYLHEEHAVAALEAGIPVYLEKPMAITIEGCDRVLAAAEANGVKLFVGHNMRYMNIIRKMKALIDDGAIGEVRAIWSRHFISYGGDAYFRDWHSEREKSTGMLLQKGAHDIDVMHWLTGCNTTRVSAFGNLSVYNRCERREETETGRPAFVKEHWPPLEQSGFSPKMDVEDQTTMIMEMENGVLGTYMQCHFTPDCCRNYTIIGTEGRLENMGDGPTSPIFVWNRRSDSYSLIGDEVYYGEPSAGGGHGGADQIIVTEFLEGRITLRSEAEIPLDMALQLQRTRPNAASRILLDEKVSLRGRSGGVMLQKAPTEHQSFSFALDGRELQAGDTLTHRASCPPEHFANEICRIIPPASCSNVGCDQNGRLINTAGERVIVRLSRPSLSSKRNWWLLRGLIAARAPRKLLVVAAPEEWGGEPFREALEVAGQLRGMDIDITPWETSFVGVSRLLASLGVVARKMQGGDYDGLLLVPPLSDLATGIDARTMSRALACFAELGSAELGRQRIWIALPPSYRPEIPRSESFERAMLRIIGDYGVQAVPLATWLESKPDELASAYEVDGIVQSGPVAMRDAIAEYLIAWICGDQI